MLVSGRQTVEEELKLLAERMIAAYDQVKACRARVELAEHELQDAHTVRKQIEDELEKHVGTHIQVRRIAVGDKLVEVKWNGGVSVHNVII